MPWTLSGIAAFAYNGLNDVPTSISGAVMQDIALQSVFFVNNYNKTSISGNNISDTHFNPIVNLTKAWTLARMAQVGANFNWSLGEFSVNKGGSNNTEEVQVQQFFDNAMIELNAIGRPFRWAKANV